jgi:phosphoribosyl 1,2-cyclic phosphodiesterase
MIKFCSLFSGSSGNSLFIANDDTRILIDAGLSGKRIVAALNEIDEKPIDLNAILITHEHIDHIRGAGILSRKYNIPVYANESTWEAMAREIGPIRAENKMSFQTNCAFEINGIGIHAFQIPHDASEPVGFNFFVENKKVTTATDIGHINDALMGYFEKSDLILLESNHDVEMLRVGPYPWSLKQRILSDKGHLSNEMAGKVIAHMALLGTQRFLIGHLSQENNFPLLAYQTVYNSLHEKNIAVGEDITLEVVLRDRVGSIVQL